MLFGTGFSISMQKRSDTTMEELNIEIEELEPKVAPSAHGQRGYEGQPGNQDNVTLGCEGHPRNQGGHRGLSLRNGGAAGRPFTRVKHGQPSFKLQLGADSTPLPSF